jgi:hypothetical protein
LPDDFNVAARAVSGGANGSAPPCLLATEETLKDAFKVNSGTVSTTGCDIQVNSDHQTRALYVNSQGSLEADPINIVGDYSGTGYYSSTPNVDMPAIADPLSGLPPQSTSGGCDYNSFEADTGTHPLTPGIYCGGIKVSGDAQVTMQSGNYVIMDGTNPDSSVNPGSFQTSGNTASITGDGVSIYFDGDSSISVTGQSTVDLSAPTSGTYTGILFQGDPNASTDTMHTFAGGSTSIFDGVMYFPNAIAKINGTGNTANNTDISAIMARQLRFGGNGTLNFHFNDGANLPLAFQTKLTLVE